MNNGLIGTLLEFVVSLFSGSPEVQVSIPLSPSPQTTGIDWTNGECRVTPHFKVKDCLMLHSYNRLATEADGADFQKLTTLCQKMEQIRNVLECEINVHCTFRSKAYNQSQGIKPEADVHSMNEAMDFDCNGNLTIQEIKDRLIPVLDLYGIRLERGTTTWCHVDVHSVGPSGRYFTV